jgi:hypothetical protein
MAAMRSIYGAGNFAQLANKECLITKDKEVPSMKLIFIYCRDCITPWPKSLGILNFVSWCLIFVVPQYWTCFMSPFCKLVSNICGSSVLDLLHVSILPPRIFLWLPQFWKICAHFIYVLSFHLHI